MITIVTITIEGRAKAEFPETEAGWKAFLTLARTVLNAGVDIFLYRDGQLTAYLLGSASPAGSRLRRPYYPRQPSLASTACENARPRDRALGTRLSAEGGYHFGGAGPCRFKGRSVE
jgi:hypothetical protein